MKTIPPCMYIDNPVSHYLATLHAVNRCDRAVYFIQGRQNDQCSFWLRLNEAKTKSTEHAILNIYLWHK